MKWLPWERINPDEVWSTGHATLDMVLAGGWPRGGLTEVVYPGEGSGEINLLLPVFAQLTRERYWVVWVDPPYLPYAPALEQAGIDLDRFLLVEPANDADQRWAVERCLGAADCGATVFWRPPSRSGQWRRWQQAVGRGGGLGFWVHPGVGSAMMPALRLQVSRGLDGGTDIEILKRRRGFPRGPVRLP